MIDGAPPFRRQPSRPTAALSQTQIPPTKPTTHPQDGKIRKHVLMSLCTLVAGAVTFAVVYCQSLPALVALMYFQGLSLGA